MEQRWWIVATVALLVAGVVVVALSTDLWVTVRTDDPAPAVELVAYTYTDPYGSTAPGGAGTVPATIYGSVATDAGNGIDSLSVAPLALMIQFAVVLAVVMAIRMVLGMFS